MNYKTLLLFIFFSLLSITSYANVVFPKWDDDGDGFKTQSYTVSKGGKLDVSLGSGNIHIKAWNKDEVFVKVSGLDDEDMHRVKIKQNGNTIRVEYHNNWGSWSGNNDIDVTASIPNQFDIDIETSGGDIQIEDGLQGTLKGTTSGGNVKIGDVGGTVDMETSGGYIYTGDIKGDITLNTSGGDIHLGSVSGEAEVNTSGGDIRVTKIQKGLKAKTAGGEIIIGDCGADVTLATFGGDVRVAKVMGKAILSSAGGDIVLRGSTNAVKAKTADGDILLEDIAGPVDAKTAAGEISAELVQVKGQCKLATASGDVHLFVPEEAKATINARVVVRGWWKNRKDDNSIRSDFKTESYDEDDDEHEIRAVYKLNGGGYVIDLQTALGNIEIRKLKKYK